MKIAKLIQARSNSSRFPRKHLADLGGKPMIVQIIHKLKRLKGLDVIILSTTKNRTDNELCNVAWKAGATINRGPEFNLLERDQQAVFVHDLDAILTISGDCPFFSNECCQLLIDAVRESFTPSWNYDTVGGFASLTAAWGFVPSITMARIYEKYVNLMKKYEGKYSYEQYWLVGNEEPESFFPYVVDTKAFLAPEVTPMKLSIDWNLERLFWNKVIDWLGYYPETIDDFNKAFGGITEL